MNFIPKLTQANRGHFVTIQPSSQAAKPFLDTKSEIRELIRHLSNSNNSINNGSSFNLAEVQMPSSGIAMVSAQQLLQFSTIIYKTKTNNSDSKLNILDLNVCEIAERIINSIQCEKQCIEINERRSLIEYILNIIKLKCS